MNKTIITLVGIIVIGGAAAFIMLDQKSTTPNKVVVVDATGKDVAALNQETAPAGKKMAFSEFIKQGGNYQCTVNQYIDAAYPATTQGTVYIANSMIRGNYTTQIQGMNIDTSVIVRDGFAYTWTSLSPTGYKARVTNEGVTQSNSTQVSGSFSWNADMIGDYNCDSWTVNNSEFTVPKSVTFQEIK